MKDRPPAIFVIIDWALHKQLVPVPHHFNPSPFNPPYFFLSTRFFLMSFNAQRQRGLNSSSSTTTVGNTSSTVQHQQLSNTQTHQPFSGTNTAEQHGHGPIPKSVASKHRFVTELSQCLYDFVLQLLPTQEEMAVKEDVRKLLERLIRTIEPNSRLLSFGSTANGFSLRNSGTFGDTRCVFISACLYEIFT